MAVSFAYGDDDKPMNWFLKKALSEIIPVLMGINKKSPAFPRGFRISLCKRN